MSLLDSFVIKSKFISILWSLLKKHKKHFLLCICLVMFSSVVMGSALTMILPIVNSLFPSGEEGVVFGGESYFGKVLGLYKGLLSESEYKEVIPLGILFIMMTINSGIQFFIVWVNSGLTAKLTSDCRERIYNTIQNMKLASIEKYSRGMFVQLLITETRSVYAVFKQILQVIATCINALIIVALMVLLSWKLCMILLAGFILLVILNLSIVSKIKLLGKVALDYRAQLTNWVTEAIWGLKQSKMLRAESIIAEKLNGVSRGSEDVARHLQIKTAFQPLLSQNLSMMVMLLIVMAWLFFPVFSEGIPKTAGMITFLVLMSRLTPSLAAISKEYGTIFANLPALIRVNEFLSKEAEVENGGNQEPASFLDDKICFRNIYFEYSSNKPVLRSINLEIKRGSYIGIVGPSGEGKSTMLCLFARIYDPIDGEIFIDDVNLREFRLPYLRSHIGMISQDFFLFNATVRENLLMAKPSAKDKDIWNALGKSGLADFVHSLEKKLDTSVGNNGDRLSEGQRQRLCLAIIFLRNPDVVILDEGTSSVDKDTEAHILTSIRELHRKGTTIISSAHKESALIDAERIYQLVDGQLRLAK